MELTEPSNGLECRRDPQHFTVEGTGPDGSDDGLRCLHTRSSSLCQARVMLPKKPGPLPFPRKTPYLGFRFPRPPRVVGAKGPPMPVNRATTFCHVSIPPWQNAVSWIPSSKSGHDVLRRFHTAVAECRFVDSSSTAAAPIAEDDVADKFTGIDKASMRSLRFSVQARRQRISCHPGAAGRGCPHLYFFSCRCSRRRPKHLTGLLLRNLNEVTIMGIYSKY